VGSRYAPEAAALRVWQSDNPEYWLAIFDGQTNPNLAAQFNQIY
jgi:hypothetical protein